MQVYSLRLWSVASEGQVITFGGTIYFAVDGTFAHFPHWAILHTQNIIALYSEVFHVRAVNMISKYPDKICKQGQALSHFASDLLAYLNLAE